MINIAIQWYSQHRAFNIPC